MGKKLQKYIKDIENHVLLYFDFFLLNAKLTPKLNSATGRDAKEGAS